MTSWVLGGGCLGQATVEPFENAQGAGLGNPWYFAFGIEPHKQGFALFAGGAEVHQASIGRLCHDQPGDGPDGRNRKVGVGLGWQMRAAQSSPFEG